MDVLIAIDHSEVSHKAVQFAADVWGQASAGGVSLTLMHVVESLPDFVLSRAVGGTGDAYRTVVSEWETDNKSLGERLLGEQKQLLVAAGIPDGAIRTKLVMKKALPEAKKVAAAQAIIDEMRGGPYQVVCLGRRSAPEAEGVFPGSVAEKVLRSASGRTVCVVD